MILREVSGQRVADREMLAWLLGVSARTVRRHCADAYLGRDWHSGAALYDAAAAGAALRAAGVRARPARRIAA